MDQQVSSDLHGAHTITLGCPVDCLKAVLSLMTFNTLNRAYGAPFDPPETAGDVLKLCREHRLGQITDLGRRCLGEIEVGLVSAGLSFEHTPSAYPGIAVMLLAADTNRGVAQADHARVRSRSLVLTGADQRPDPGAVLFAVMPGASGAGPGGEIERAMAAGPPGNVLLSRREFPCREPQVPGTGSDAFMTVWQRIRPSQA